MPDTAPPPHGRWREPTILIPLRWGGHRSRAWGGLALIISGGVAVAGANVYTPWLFALGAISHLVGWCVMPSAGWRRVLVLAPSLVGVALVLGGPQFLFGLALPYASWLVVRHRPARSWPTVSFVLAGALLLGRIFTLYSDMVTALGIELAVIVASAWCARLLHDAGRSRRLPSV